MIEQHPMTTAIYFKTMIQSVRDLILILTPQLTIEDVSQSFLNKFGLKEADVKGQSVFEIANKCFDNPQFRELAASTFKTNKSVQDFYLSLNFDELGKRDLVLSVQPFHCDDDGSVLMLMLVINDVTEVNALRQQMEQFTGNLQRRNENLDMFARTVAHDLKNPISSMIGYASLIKAYFDRMDRVDILDIANEIIEGGYHTQKIIDALLLLATLERDDDIPQERLDMQRITENIYRSLDSLIREKQARIDHPEEWPLAYGYDAWIETIWANLVSNAIKYGGNPPVIVLGAERLPDGRSHFWVQDNGNGLTEEQQKLIFKPFERIEGYRKSVEGHGLGLAIVRRILDRLKGEIIVESEVGKGSRFGFILPANLNPASTNVQK